MKLIHTADWHIGKLLGDKSRLPEQRIVLSELVDMAEENQADVICISGDIYDNGTPSAAAEELFCDTIKKLSDDGQRLVVIIAGNHDKAERLQALSPLARDHGILIFGSPRTQLTSGTYGAFEVTSLAPGVFSTTIKGEKAVFACLPYVSEKLLGEIIYRDMGNDEEDLQSYENKMESLYSEFDNYFSDDTINICLSHVFTVGYEGDSSERSTQLGGSYLLNAAVFPKKAQYIALGHVHKPQKVSGTKGSARYSGSILPYHSDEVKTAKQCNLIEVHPGLEITVTPLLFSNPKPIERWVCSGYAEARDKCEENKDRSQWVFLRILTDDVILEDQIRELKELKSDLLEITPVHTKERTPEDEDAPYFRQEENVMELFKSFYTNKNGTEPSEEIITLLEGLVGEEGA